MSVKQFFILFIALLTLFLTLYDLFKPKRKNLDDLDFCIITFARLLIMAITIMILWL